MNAIHAEVAATPVANSGRDGGKKMESNDFRTRVVRRARTGLFAMVAAALTAVSVVLAPAAHASHGESSTVLFVYAAGTESSVSTYGQSLTLVAHVSDSSFSCLSVLRDCDPPSGTVSFYYYGPGGEEILMGTATHDFFTSSDSSFEIEYCCLPAGVHNLTALYRPQADGGGNHFIPSIGKGQHTVQKAAPVIQLHQSSASTDVGQSVTFTASITPVSVAAAAPAGTVQFTDNGAALGAPVPLAGGRAVLTTSSLGPGSHVIRAEYSGDANHQSVASQVTHAVRSPATSTTLTSSPNPSTPGQSVLLQATVSAADGVTPTGTVVFSDGGSPIGFASLASGKASLSVSNLSPGPHALTADYGGDATHAPSTSATVTQTVNRHPSATALSSSANPSVPGQAVTFRAVVTTTGPGPVTGTVTFKDGATTLGTAPIAEGVATLTTASLAVGTHTVTAHYSGDAAHAPSASPGLSQAVVACTITVAGPGLSTAGTAGADVICGTAGADDIAGMGGNDVIVGFGGNDRLAGGDGNDTIHGGEGDDRLTGGAGDDRLTGDAGTDAATGDAGTDTCSAEASAFCEVPAPA
jgi:Ca2+-binding RTX toxin-like protein